MSLSLTHLWSRFVSHSATKQERSRVSESDRRPAFRVPYTVSDKGVVSIRATDALKDKSVRAQLAIVSRIRTGNTSSK